MSEQYTTPLAVLRLPDVKTRTGLSRSTIYERIAKGEFPKPVHLGADARCVGWVAGEVEAWIAEQIANSRKSS